MAFRPTHLLLAVAVAVFAGAAHADDDGSLVRLSPEEIARIQAEAEAKPAPGTAAPDRARPRIHGEVGASIGTGGSREIFGALNMPLGEDGRALVSGGAAARALPQRPIRRNLDRR